MLVLPISLTNCPMWATSFIISLPNGEWWRKQCTHYNRKMKREIKGWTWFGIILHKQPAAEFFFLKKKLQLLQPPIYDPIYAMWRAKCQKWMAELTSVNRTLSIGHMLSSKLQVWMLEQKLRKFVLLLLASRFLGHCNQWEFWKAETRNGSDLKGTCPVPFLPPGSLKLSK